jgi:hypothetical protein
MAKLVIEGTNSASRLWLARRMVTCLAAELPGRKISVAADSAYAGDELKEVPPGVTWTTRLRSNAARHGLPPEPTGKRGNPGAVQNALAVSGAEEWCPLPGRPEEEAPASSRPLWTRTIRPNERASLSTWRHVCSRASLAAG